MSEILIHILSNVSVSLHTFNFKSNSMFTVSFSLVQSSNRF